MDDIESNISPFVKKWRSFQFCTIIIVLTTQTEEQVSVTISEKSMQVVSKYIFNLNV